MEWTAFRRSLPIAVLIACACREATDPGGDDGAHLVYSVLVPDEDPYSLAHVRSWIALARADGTGERRLTPDPGRNAFEDRPTWSPDGSQIAFDSDRDGSRAIYVIAADGSGLRRVASGWSPTWSPDGQRIAFIAVPPGRPSTYLGQTEVFVMNADGSGLRQLTDNADDELDVSWSPDGAWLAVSVMDGGTIVLLAADGSIVVPLFASPTRAIFGAWSPDGSEIAFTATGYIPSRRVLGVVRVSNGVVRYLTRALDAVTPAWSPDGRRIYFNDGSWIASIRPDGSDLRLVFRDEKPRASPDLRRIP